MENKQITLVQLPIIKHQLKEAGKEVSKRIEDLQLDKQVATIDTLKSLKTTRTELNKELSDLELQRKTIKKAVNTPYNEFEDVYKTEISDKYKKGLDVLKDKIAFVENDVKSKKRDSVKIYFDELCVAEKIDFIAFEKLGIEVNLSTAEKKYKEQVYSYIEGIIDDLKLIKTTDFEAEILTEYKTTLNVSGAITSVKTRKESEAKEVARLKAEKIQQRKNYLEELGFKYVDITKTYEFNEDILIELSEIENLSKEDFIVKWSELQVKVSDFKLKEAKAKTARTPEVEKVEKPTVKKVITVSAPVQAPKIEKKPEPLKTASFEVTATMTQLRALGAYMKENNITYKNI